MKNIPYLEIRDKYTLNAFAMIEPAEFWGELSYYDIGQCEIYAVATPYSLGALRKGNYITIPNTRFIWLITSVQYVFTSEGSRMISAKGYEAKYLLSKRVILDPYPLESDLDKAVYNLVNNNLGSGASKERKIEGFSVEYPTTGKTTDAQATRGNLADFLNALLKLHKLGSYVTYENGGLIYRIIQGRNMTGSVLFSQSLDNLLSSSYSTDDTKKKTFCQVVNSFDKDNVKTDYPTEVDQGETGIDRDEMTASPNITNKYTDKKSGKEVEVDPASDTYKQWQIAEGNSLLAENTTTEQVSGDIDMQGSGFEFDKDYFLGDLVGVRDEYFKISFAPRITKITFKQNSKGYGEELEYSAD